MRKLLALAVQVPLVLSVYGACSGGGDTGDAGDGAADVRAEKPNLDTGILDTGPTCAPAPVSSSSITWTPPHAPDPSACSDQQILGYFSACLTPPFTNCNSFTTSTANTACVSCLVSTEGTSSTFGALISTGHHVVYANFAGCIALEQNDTSGTGCGAKYWEANQCEDLSCAANCPVVSSDPTTLQAYQACTQQAATTECKTYESALCDLSDAGALQATCGMTAKTFQDALVALGAVFCGGYPADAGPPSDAGADATADATADADDGSADAGVDAPDGD